MQYNAEDIHLNMATSLYPRMNLEIRIKTHVPVNDDTEIW